MGSIAFASREDTVELVKALEAEGYTTTLTHHDGRWTLEVEPFDEQVAALVDVYGGWLPDDARLDG